MLVGPQVVDPQLLRPRPARPRHLAVEEQHVGLDALGVEDARGQAQHRVQVVVGEQFAADGLAGAAFEEDVVGQHDGGATVGLEDRHDVLHEVELLVARRGDEVLSLDLAVVAALASVRAHHRDG